MTSLQNTRKKALNLQGLLSSQNLILTQAYLPNSAVFEASGAKILGAKTLWQLFLNFYLLLLWWCLTFFGPQNGNCFTILPPRILRWLPHFWQIFAPVL